MAGVTHMVQRLIAWTVQAVTVSVFMISPICERRMRLCEYRSMGRLYMQVPSRHDITRAQKVTPYPFGHGVTFACDYFGRTTG